MYPLFLRNLNSLDVNKDQFIFLHSLQLTMLSIQANRPGQIPLLSFQYQLVEVQSSPVHHFNVISNISYSILLPSEIARLVTQVPRVWRGLTLVFHYSPFSPGSSPLTLRKKGRLGGGGGIAEVTLNKWLLVTGGKKSLLPHWLDPFPTVAGGFCQCVDALLDNEEHGIICFRGRCSPSGRTFPSLRIAQRGRPCLPLSNKQSCPQLLSVWLSSYLVHSHQSSLLLLHFLFFLEPWDTWRSSFSAPQGLRGNW